jgi:hypothetical protein
MQAVQCHLVVKAPDADAASAVAERVQNSTEISACLAARMDPSIHSADSSDHNNCNQVP